MSAAEAPARAALAGNPSDLFGGAVLALPLEELFATARAEPAAKPRAEPASELVTAAIRRFAGAYGPWAIGTSVSWSTSIPRGVGLGGSSAIVIAVLRALGELYGVEAGPDELARLALAVEVEELGIAAGLQDRLAQSHGGLSFMEFSGCGTCESLAAALLPPLVVAWLPQAASDSGAVHAGWRDGPSVREAMRGLARLAREARNALVSGDHERLRQSVDASFDARRRLTRLDPRHVALIERARAQGAAANYTGSGGAIVAVCRDRRHAGRVAEIMTQCGCGVLLR